MCNSGRGSRRKIEEDNGKQRDDGFGGWGGYMAAKRAKLLDQFHNENIEKISDIFAGVRILVNGLTHPSAAELKNLMAAHGGEFHMYQISSTTHIIASNLPNVKIKHLGAVPVVKPAWITESIALNKLLDYSRYLLYTNQSRLQPALNFPVIPKPSASDTTETIVKATELDNTNFQLERNMGAISEVPNIILTNGDQPLNDKKHSGSIVATGHQNTSVSKATTSGTRITKTASDPRFLEEFYNNSRLHLISTLGAEFKQLVSQLRERSDGKFPGRERLIIEKA